MFVKFHAALRELLKQTQFAIGTHLSHLAGVTSQFAPLTSFATGQLVFEPSHLNLLIWRKVSPMFTQVAVAGSLSGATCALKRQQGVVRAWHDCPLKAYTELLARGKHNFFHAKCAHWPPHVELSPSQHKQLAFVFKCEHAFVFYAYLWTSLVEALRGWNRFAFVAWRSAKSTGLHMLSFPLPLTSFDVQTAATAAQFSWQHSTVAFALNYVYETMAASIFFLLPTINWHE